MSIAEKLTTVAENVPKVYEAGKKAEYDEFWDSYQANGTRTNYEGLFTKKGWNNTTFKPKYDMYPTDAFNMFCGCSITGLLKDRLNGKILDTSNATITTQIFANSTIGGVGEIDVRKAPTDNHYMFGWNYSLHTIDKLIVDENTTYTGWFNSTTNLQNLTIEGTIAKNGFSVGSCTKLSRASIENIINALSDTTTGLTVTLSKTAVNNAFETSTGLADGSTSQEWANLIGTKTNWTISLS